MYEKKTHYVMNLCEKKKKDAGTGKIQLNIVLLGR